MGLPCRETALPELSVYMLTACFVCCPLPCPLKETRSLPDGSGVCSLWVLWPGAGVGWSSSRSCADRAALLGCGE